MVTYTLNSSGECSNCKTVASEETTLKCEDCKKYVHAICGSEAPYASKTFVANFNKVKVRNFLFLCDFCLTKRENNEASTLKDQMENLTETVKTLVQTSSHSSQFIRQIMMYNNKDFGVTKHESKR